LLLSTATNGDAIGAGAYGHTQPATAQPQAPSWTLPGTEAFPPDPENGLIVQTDKDGGDTAQREGMAWFAIALLQERNIQPVVTPPLPWAKAIALLEDGKTGQLRRHPSKDRPNKLNPWSDVNDFSRDQQAPIVAALGLLGPADLRHRLATAFEARGRRCQNGEPGGPDHQNFFRRAFSNTGEAIGKEPIEAFGEALLAGMVLSLAVRGKKDRGDVGDDLNFLLSLTVSRRWRSTQTSEAAICEYFRTRPWNYGCFLEAYHRETRNARLADTPMKDEIKNGIAAGWRPECHPVIGALRWYCRAESNGGWGPATLYEQVINQYLQPGRCAAAV
jgi:hypothetical protein